MEEGSIRDELSALWKPRSPLLSYGGRWPVLEHQRGGLLDADIEPPLRLAGVEGQRQEVIGEPLLTLVSSKHQSKVLQLLLAVADGSRAAQHVLRDVVHLQHHQLHHLPGRRLAGDVQLWRERDGRDGW